MICGHTGGDWELGVRAIRGRKEIFGDLAGSDPTAGYVEMAVRELGAERIIYGSDAYGRSFSSQIAKVVGARITEAQKQRILRDNLRELMLPILTAKGVRT
jgi:predicted TIM-barrel fold metal-dependent hydrolase